MNTSLIETQLRLSPVIPVIVINALEDALPLAEALLAGGIGIMEITLRSQSALAAIETIRNNCPEMCVGAGTVNTPQRMQQAVEAGAQFLVCPGATSRLIETAKSYQTPLLPGASTASEAMKLFEQGYQHIKFFPAEAAGGSKMLKSLAGPLPQITFCPTGGIDMDNYLQYLELSNVVCVGSSWVANEAIIQERNWNEITRRSKLMLLKC
jgi:2-dehydro-3-deoxyphosphogluconate aldolase/(4S)-4-hydroxy-2-oxoglutarate aldolase